MPGSCCNLTCTPVVVGGNFSNLWRLPVSCMFRVRETEPEMPGMPAEGAITSASCWSMRCPLPAGWQSYNGALLINVLHILSC